MAKLKIDPWMEEYLESKDIVISNPEKMIDKWNTEVFSKKQPLWVELGMKKGEFIIKQAKLNPDVNIVGIEKVVSKQIVAVQNIVENPLENLVFISGDSLKVTTWFKEGSLDKIFINFPNPWPDTPHTQMRFLFNTILNEYHTILKSGGHIELKTDQLSFFEFIIDEVKQKNKFEIKNVNMDLDKEDFLVQTEYEKKHITSSDKIYYLELHK